MWTEREVNEEDLCSLGRLMEAGGVNGFGEMAEEAWSDYVNRIADGLGMEPGQSVLEVGCGAGALLFVLTKRGLRISGIDYSSTQIERARKVLPQGSFACLEATALPPEPRQDYALANGVFMYMPDLDYAAEALGRMLAAARRGAAVLDVPDLATREACEAARRRALDPEEHARRYTGLDHLYIARDWLPARAAEHGWRTEIKDQDFRGHPLSPFRYNAFFWPEARQS
jgi:trans-aconitate methyltransferase